MNTVKQSFLTLSLVTGQMITLTLTLGKLETRNNNNNNRTYRALSESQSALQLKEKCTMHKYPYQLGYYGHVIILYSKINDLLMKLMML